MMGLKPSSFDSGAFIEAEARLTLDDSEAGERVKRAVSARATFTPSRDPAALGERQDEVLYNDVLSALEKAEEAAKGLDEERGRQAHSAFNKLYEQARQQALQNKDPELLNENLPSQTLRARTLRSRESRVTARTQRSSKEADETKRLRALPVDVSPPGIWVALAGSQSRVLMIGHSADFKIRVLRFVIFCKSCFLALLISGFATSHLADAQDETSLVIPIVDDGAMIRTPVTIFGEKLYFAIDTGSAISSIDTAYVDRLGTPIQKADQGPLTAESKLAAYKCPEFFVGKMRSDLEVIACVDLGMFRLITGEQCDGILGMDFLQRYVVSLDIDKQLLTLSNKVPEDVKNKAIAIRFASVDRARPCVEALLNDSLRIALMVDSANNQSISLTRDKWEKLLSSASHLKTGSTLNSAVENRAARVLTARVESLQVGSSKYANLICSQILIADVPSTLGLPFLRRNLATFDFPAETLYLQPRSGLNHEDEADMSGLHLLRENGRTFVHSVDPASPADRAGAQAGDVIVSINGQSAPSLKMAAVRDILRAGDGQEVSLEMRRNNEPLDVRFLLKKSI